MVIGDIIKELQSYLDRTEIFVILEFVLDKNKTEILTNLETCVNDDDKEKIFKMARRRVNKEPLQYITHNQYFFGNKFYVNENVLIPRADTEILVEEVLKSVTGNENILDLCTGSGCIAISLKKANEALNVSASDISTNALTVAMINAKINNADVNFVKSDLFDNINKKYDIIVSNPPYIKKCDMKILQEEVKHEPILALDGGNSGLEYYEKIIEQAKKYLTDKGVIALEIGYNQAEDVSNLLIKNNYADIKVIKDYGNNDRAIIAKAICT